MQANESQPFICLHVLFSNVLCCSLDQTDKEIWRIIPMSMSRSAALLFPFSAQLFQAAGDCGRQAGTSASEGAKEREADVGIAENGCGTLTMNLPRRGERGQASGFAISGQTVRGILKAMCCRTTKISPQTGIGKIGLRGFLGVNADVLSVGFCKAYFSTPSSLPTLMNAAMHLSRCSRSCAAEICTRMRA